MSSATVRINDETHKTLRDLAEKTGAPMQTVLKDAIEFYRRQKFLDEMNEAYASLKAHPTEWKKEIEERSSWDLTTGDGQNEE